MMPFLQHWIAEILFVKGKSMDLTICSNTYHSLDFFSKMCNSKWFRSTPIILLLSKYDLFHEKIAETSLSVCFDDYDGECNYLKGLKFLLQKFNHVRDKGEKGVNTNIYQQVTTRDMSNEELANNLGGCFSCILYEKKEMEKKQRKIDASLSSLSGDLPSLTVSDSNSSAQTSPRTGTDIKHKLFSGLLQRLKKK